VSLTREPVGFLVSPIEHPFRVEVHDAGRGERSMMTSAEATETIQVHKAYIKATPQAVWEALTKPEWTVKYGYAPLVEYELRAGGKFRAHPNAGMKALGMPDIIIDGEVIEASPPQRIVQTWRLLMDAGMAAEGFTRLMYEIEEVRGGVTKVTVTHDCSGAPKIMAMFAGDGEASGAGGGWTEVLSGLKTLLETGDQLPFQSGPKD
jgi:uncharacterized protein YndB with AHSA1/START domain